MSFVRNALLRRRAKLAKKKNAPKQWRLGVEQLEERSMLATFNEPGGGLLDLDFNVANKSLDIVSNGATYSLTLTGDTWSGADSTNATGDGLATLTVTADAFDNIKIADSAVGSAVNFTDSGANKYTDNFNVTLDDAAASTISFSGATTFDGSAELSASTTLNIVVNSGASITTEDGNLTLSANMQVLPTAGDFVGIDINNATVSTSGTGAISLLGRGGDDAGTGSHHGVSIRAGGVVTSTSTLAGAGTITIEGTAGEGNGSDVGVIVFNANSKVSTDQGNIQITGKSSGAATGGSNIGVDLEGGGQVISTGTGATAGTITISGTGGGGSTGNQGIRIDGNGSTSFVSSVAGDIQLTGTATAIAGTNQDGVFMTDAGTITTTGDATLLVTGITGTTDTAIGVGLRLGGTNPSTLNLTGATNTFVGDSMVFDTTNFTIDAGANSVTLRQNTNGTALDLGGADATGTLGLTDAELNRVTAGTLHVGSSTSGNITISASLTPAGVSTLELETGGSMQDGPADVLTVTNLVLTAGTNIASNSDALGITASTLTATSGVGTSGDLIVNSIGSVILKDINADGGASDFLLNVQGLGSEATQEAGTSITASGLLLLGAGKFTLDNAGNKVATIAASLATSNTGTLSYTDSDALNVGTVEGINGILTTDSNVTLSTLAGTLTVTDGNASAAADINAGTGEVSLTAVSTGIGNNQALIILTDAGVSGTGGVTLVGDNIAILAKITATGNTVTVRQSQDGTLIDLGGADLAGGNEPGTLGLTSAELDRVTAGTLKIGDANSGAITLSTAIAPAGTTVLSLETGAGVSQGVGDTITVASLAIRAATTVTLNENNVVTNLAASVSTSGEDFEFRDDDGFAITTVDSLPGIAVSTTAASGSRITLDSGPITQSATGSVVGDELELLGTGVVNLDATLGAANDVNVLAASRTGSPSGVRFNDTNGLIVGTAGGTDGLTVVGDTFIKVATTLEFQKGITNTGVGTGTILDVGTSATQTAGDASDKIVASRLNFRGTGTFTLDEATNDAVSLSVPGGTVGEIIFVDANDLDLGEPDPGDDFATNDANATITAAGSMNIDQDVNVGAGKLTLNIGGALTQEANDTITAAELELLGTGTATLTDAGNDVGTLVINKGDAVSIRDANTVTWNTSNVGAATITLEGGRFNVGGGETVTAATVNVNIGATLGGSGTVTAVVTVNAGGVVSPGASPGSLSTGNISFADNTSSFDVEVDSSTPGTGHDQLSVTGTVDLNDATLNVSGTITSVPGQKVLLISNDGAEPISGTFDGIAEGDTVTINTVDFTISYKAGSKSNDVVLYQTGPATFEADGKGAGALTVRLNGAGTFIEFLDDGDVVESRPLATITDKITVNGTDGADETLTVDYTNGFIDLDIEFLGGEGAADNDGIVVLGGVFTTVTSTYTAPTLADPEHNGSLVYNTGAATATITYTGLEPINITGSTIADLVFNLPGTADDAILEDDGTPNDGVLQLRSQNGTFDTTAFSTPTGSVTINMGGDAGKFTVATLDSKYDASLTINGDGDTDTVTVTGALNLGSATSAGALTITSETINLNNATINTNAVAAAAGGDVTFNGSVVLGANVSINTNHGVGADGKVNFNGSVDADDNTVALADRELVVDAGTSTISFTGSIGAAAKGALADLDLTATTINLNAVAVNVDDDDAAVETVTFTGAVVLQDSVSIDTDKAAGADNSLTFTSTIDADDAANNRTLTIDAGATGIVALNGAVGGGQALQKLTIDDADDVSLAAVTTRDGGISVVTSGATPSITTTGALLTTSLVTPGPISLTSDDMAIGAAVNAGTETVSLLTATGGRAIDLGTETAGQLSLTAAELNQVTAGILRVGSGASGAITVSQAINTANTNTLALTTGAGVSQGVGFTITEPNLAVVAGTTVALGEANEVDTLAGLANGDFSYRDATGFALDAVAGTNDVTSTTGSITFNATAAVTQAGANGEVFAQTAGEGLELLGTGSYALTQAGNDVANLAGNVTGDISYRDTDGFILNTVGATNDVTSTAGSVTFNAAAAVTQAGVNGEVFAQTAGEGLELLGTGSYALTQAGNDVANLAGNVTGDISYRDANGFILDTVGATSDINSTTGSITFNAAAAVTQAGVNGQVFAQTAGEGLELLGTGSYNLNQVGNDVANLAGNVTGGITFRDVNALIISTVQATIGLNSGGGNVDIGSGSTQTINNDVGTSGAGTIRLEASLTAAGTDLDINASITTPGTGNIDLLADRQIDVADTRSVTTTSGALDITAKDVNSAGAIITILGTTSGSVGGGGGSKFNTQGGADTISVQGERLSATNNFTWNLNAGADVATLLAGNDRLGAASVNINGGADAVVDRVLIDAELNNVAANVDFVEFTSTTDGTGRFGTLAGVLTGNNVITFTGTERNQIDIPTSVVIRGTVGVANVLNVTKINENVGLATGTQGLLELDQTKFALITGGGVVAGAGDLITSQLNNIANLVEAIIVGGPGADIINGTGKNELILGGGGVDQIFANDGTDFLFPDAAFAANGTLFDVVANGETVNGGPGIDSAVSLGIGDIIIGVEGSIFAPSAQLDIFAWLANRIQASAQQNIVDALALQSVQFFTAAGVSFANGIAVPPPPAVIGNVAVAAVADAGGLRLDITGDVNPNQLLVELGTNGKNSVRITGAPGTTINGGTVPVVFLGIDKGINAALLAGNDEINIKGRNFKSPIKIDGGADNDRYLLSAKTATYEITDAGGVDEINFSEATNGVKLDLSLPTLQKIGASRNVTLGASQIENLVGSRFVDRLTGNAADNIIHGGAGSDTINGGGGRNLLYGEAGNDKLTSTAGSTNVMVGGVGNDRLTSLATADILIGGVGKDRLTGNLTTGNSLLIGGSSAHDVNADAALLDLLAEWASAGALGVRVANINGGLNLANGNTLIVPATVTDDALTDTLRVAVGNNFIFRQGKDKLKGNLGTDIIQP